MQLSRPPPDAAQEPCRSPAGCPKTALFRLPTLELPSIRPWLPHPPIVGPIQTVVWLYKDRYPPSQSPPMYRCTCRVFSTPRRTVGQGSSASSRSRTGIGDFAPMGDDDDVGHVRVLSAMLGESESVWHRASAYVAIGKMFSFLGIVTLKPNSRLALRHRWNGSCPFIVRLSVQLSQLPLSDPSSMLTL
ncbi:hypothetical protein M3J07_008685 [Ascochyta lentis]